MGKLVEIKTKPTELKAADFINAIEDVQKRNDCFVIMEMMKKATKEKPKIWSNAMIGFGEVRYKSPATGREVDWLRIGFAPRKTNLSLYLMLDLKLHEETLKKLGKYKTGVGCLYINKLADINIDILEDLIKKAAKKR